jgi:hypothetical protein
LPLDGSMARQELYKNIDFSFPKRQHTLSKLGY